MTVTATYHFPLSKGSNILLTTWNSSLSANGISVIAQHWIWFYFNLHMGIFHNRMSSIKDQMWHPLLSPDVICFTNFWGCYAPSLFFCLFNNFYTIICKKGDEEYLWPYQLESGSSDINRMFWKKIIDWKEQLWFIDSTLFVILIIVISQYSILITPVLFVVIYNTIRLKWLSFFPSLSSERWYN